MQENLIDNENQRKSKLRLILLIVGVLVVIGVIILVIVLLAGGKSEKDPDNPDDPITPKEDCTLDFSRTTIDYSAQQKGTTAGLRLNFFCDENKPYNHMRLKEVDISVFDITTNTTLKKDDVLPFYLEEHPNSLNVNLYRLNLGYSNYTLTVNKTKLKEEIRLVLLPKEPTQFILMTMDYDLKSHHKYSYELHLLDREGKNVIKDNVLIQEGSQPFPYDFHLGKFEVEGLGITHSYKVTEIDGYLGIYYTFTPYFNSTTAVTTETKIPLKLFPNSSDILPTFQTFDISRSFSPDDTRLFKDDASSNNFEISLFDYNNKPIDFNYIREGSSFNRVSVSVTGDLPECSEKFNRKLGGGDIGVYQAATEDKINYKYAKVTVPTEEIKKCSGLYTILIQDNLFQDVLAERKKKYVEVKTRFLI